MKKNQNAKPISNGFERNLRDHSMSRRRTVLNVSFKLQLLLKTRAAIINYIPQSAFTNNNNKNEKNKLSS